MPEIYSVLSNDKKLVLFKGSVIDKHNVKIGITTTAFGDARTKTLMSTNNGKLASLKLRAGASSARLMKPKHKDEIIICQPDSGNNGTFDCDCILFYKNGSKVRTLLGMPLGDCPGIFIFSPEFCGVVHSGWKGTLKNIISNTIKTLLYFDTSLVKISVIIWPGICPDCYEVGHEFEDYFPGFYYNRRINLALKIKDQLLNSGILKWNIYTSENLFTCCSKPNGTPLFYSHRRKEKERVQAFMVI